jgi:hypothetical protein
MYLIFDLIYAFQLCSKSNERLTDCGYVIGKSEELEAKQLQDHDIG